MARIALALVVLGHERQRDALLRRDLLGAGLVDGVVVAGGQRLVVLERDLVLARVAFALRRLDGEAGARHLVADAAQQRFDAAGAEHGVVDVVLVGRGQAPVAGVPGLFVGVLEDDEFEFRADVGAQSALREAVELAAQDLPGRGDDGRAVAPGEVCHEQCRAGMPGHAAQAGGVGPQGEVPVAVVPGGHRVAVDGVHLGVDGEQVVAALGSVVEDVGEEERRGEPLALESALHVGKGEDDGVHLARADEPGEFAGGERGCAVCHGVLPPSVSRSLKV